MATLNIFLDGLSSEESQELYIQLAQTALEQYTLGTCNIGFLQHNSGITYRIEPADTKPCFLLKIHEPIGTGSKASFEQIQSQMQWLDKLAQSSKLIIQTPIMNKHGMFVTKMQASEIKETALCTLQNWIEGEPPDGDFTMPQVESVGRMMAMLHQTSSQSQPSVTVELEKEQIADLWDDVEQLHAMVDVNVISSTQFKTIEKAGQRVEQIIGLLGVGPEVYGPIHGDLHQGNILFFNNNVCPIDFDGLRNSYYLLDLGTTLYHILHQDAEFRKTLIDGYSALRDLSVVERSYLEAFVTWSAISNLALQATIPQQVMSKIFVRNMHQLTDKFCPKVIADEPFALVLN